LHILQFKSMSFSSWLNTGWCGCNFNSTFM
jgi:hypothetical protein